MTDDAVAPARCAFEAAARDVSDPLDGADAGAAELLDDESHGELAANHRLYGSFARIVNRRDVSIGARLRDAHVRLRGTR